MKRSSITRRGLMKGAAGMAGLSLARASGPALGARGASEKVVMGFIGTGGQGKAHIREFAKMKDVAIAAVCDVDRSQREKAAKTAGSSPKQIKDFREVLDMKDVDAVLIAPPDHWHGIIAIEACKAGKDIYCEKPMTHNIREARLLLDTVKRHKRIVQVGTQQRSSQHWINAVNRIKAGEIGKVNMVHVWNAWSTNQMRGDLGHPPDKPAPPEGVDYDMWLGPAPKRPFNPLRFHWTFYFFWDYAGGMVSDWAVHLFDVVTWVMGPDIKSVTMTGGKYVLKDARDTPDTGAAVFECPGYTMNFTIRHANGWSPHGVRGHGIEFFGENRTLQIDRRGFQMYDDKDRGSRKSFYAEEGTTPLSNHERNFIECVRSRKRTNADAQVGYEQQIPCHLANISYRVGRRLEWDAKNETIRNDPEACKLLTRTYREPWVL
jgi:predicted dehydrogenase